MEDELVKRWSFKAETPFIRGETRLGSDGDPLKVTKKQSLSSGNQKSSNEHS